MNGVSEWRKESAGIVDVAGIAGGRVVRVSGEAFAGITHVVEEDGGFVIGRIAEVLSTDHVGVEPSAACQEGLRVFSSEVESMLLQGRPRFEADSGNGSAATCVAFYGSNFSG